MFFYLFASKKNGAKKTCILFRSWLVLGATYNGEGLERGDFFCDDNHVVIFFVFEHLDFGLKGGIEAKLVCSNTHVTLCIYSNFHFFTSFLLYNVSLIMLESIKIKVIHKR
jgi:hypothetical protein